MRKRVAVAKAAFFFFVRDELRRRELQLYVLRRLRRPRIVLTSASRLRGERATWENDGGGDGYELGIIGREGTVGQRQFVSRGTKLLSYPCETLYTGPQLTVLCYPYLRKGISLEFVISSFSSCPKEIKVIVGNFNFSDAHNAICKPI